MARNFTHKSLVKVRDKELKLHPHATATTSGKGDEEYQPMAGRRSLGQLLKVCTRL